MKELWVPLSGAIAQQKKVDTLANNVANANTPGFKRDQLAFKEQLTAFQKGVSDLDLPQKEWAPEDFYRSYGAEHGFVKVDGQYTDHAQGQLSPTGNPLDLALHGKGFFEVLTPNGVRYTRNGAFALSAEGLLVNSQGFPILQKLDPKSLSGEVELDKVPKPQDRTIAINGSKVSVNLEGDIFVDNQKTASLSVVEFKDQHALVKEGNSMFINKHLDNISTETKTRINQGFIEQSNVNAVSEMSELIKAHRQFESIQKVIKAYDNMSQKGVNEIANF